MGRAQSRRIPRRLAAIAASLLGALALFGCCRPPCAHRENFREIGSVLRGENPCQCPEASPWCEYKSVFRGDNPCQCPEASPWCAYEGIWNGDNPCRCDCDSACTSPCASACACPDACGSTMASTPPPPPPNIRPGESWYRIHHPAVWETVTETVQSECPSTKQVWVPPVYRYEFHPVVVEPAKRCDLPVDGATRSVETCEVVCPERVDTCTKCVTDACGCPHTETETVVTPPKTCHHIGEVCIQPPSTHVVATPPVVMPEMCEVEVKPGHWRTVHSPAIREQVTHRVCRSQESWEWKQAPTCVPPAPRPVAPVAPCAPVAPRPVPPVSAPAPAPLPPVSAPPVSAPAVPAPPAPVPPPPPPSAPVVGPK